jgi:hypothetical protein
MALPGDRQWRKGNPNWVKGKSAYPKGKPKGYFAKANASTHRILRDKKRNPVEELIILADMAKDTGDIETAVEIWKMIHAETTAHSAAIERVEKIKTASKDLLGQLENDNDGSDTRTTPPGRETSLAAGQPSLSPEANSAGNIRRDNEVPGADIRNQLLAEAGENDDNGGGGAGDGAEDPEHTGSLRSPATERPEEVSVADFQHAPDGLPGRSEADLETI